MQLSKVVSDISKGLSDPRVIVPGILFRMAQNPFINDRAAIKLQFWARFGYSLDLNNPRTFNEKLQWLKLYDRNPLHTVLADKIRVKQWVAEKIGGQYVTPTLNVWNSADEISAETLPKEFALKTNHDSGTVLICTDSRTFDFESAKKRLNRALRRKSFYYGREWPYANINPKVFAEEFLDPLLSGGDLVDYKVLCFGGEPKVIEVHRGRFSDHTQNFYNCNWDELSITQKGEKSSSVKEEVPLLLNEMLELTRKLCRSFCHVRVDWYIYGGALRFGEMTFFDGSGFVPFDRFEDDVMLGSLIDLSYSYDFSRAMTENS